MTDPPALVRQADAYRRLAACGDLPGLAREVMRAACRNGLRTGPGAANMALLRTLPPGDRLRLGGLWAAWLLEVREEGADVFREFGRDAQFLRTELLLAASGVVRGLDGDLLAAERQRRLTALGRQFLLGPGHREWELVEAELSAGRVPGPDVLAVFRRSAQDQRDKPALRDVLDGFPGPVLNPGEPWADQALMDASARGDPWHRLLGHTAPATAGVPSQAWERKGRALLAEAGPEEVRRRVPTWWDRVGRGRKVPLRSGLLADLDHAHRYDPYNCQALRGLAWLMSLLPPDPGTSAALARLVRTALEPMPSGQAPAPGVAVAAVLALSRLDCDTARTELGALSQQITHRVTARRIATALDGTGR
jgi:hypothetical protein